MMNMHVFQFRLVMSFDLAGSCLILSSCGKRAQPNKEDLRGIQERQFLANPKAVTDAAVEVMIEMDDSFDMYVEQLNDSSFVATRTAFLYAVLSASLNEYRFSFGASENADGGTTARMVILVQAEIMFLQSARQMVLSTESYNVFWDRFARKLGEGGGEQECPEDSFPEAYNAVCLFALFPQ